MNLLRNGLLMRKTGDRRRTELTETFAFLCGFPAEFITRSKPDSEESCRRAGLSATGDLRASGVRGDRPAQIEPALRGPQGGKGPRSGQTDGRALAGESALWLQAGVGASEARRLAAQQEAGASAVAQGRSQSAREATQEAAPSHGKERERMHEEASRAQRPRLELRLRYGPDRGRQKAEDDASGGRVHERVPEHRCRALDHR